MSNQLNVRQRLNAVMKAIGYIKKDSKVSTGSTSSYAAVTHDQVTALTRSEFVNIGISVETSLVEGKTQLLDRGKDDKGNPKHPTVFFDGVYDVAFVNIDDEKDRVVLRRAAHGEDYGDKAPGKAESIAQKRAVLKILQLETGEDDESRIQHEGAEPETAERLAPYFEKIKVANNREDVGAILKAYIAEAKTGAWRTAETDKQVQEACSKRAGELNSEAAKEPAKEPAEPAEKPAASTKEAAKEPAKQTAKEPENLNLPDDPKKAAKILRAKLAELDKVPA